MTLSQINKKFILSDIMDKYIPIGVYYTVVTLDTIRFGSQIIISEEYSQYYILARF